MLTNVRIVVVVVVGSITRVHWLALLWNIWMTIWLIDYVVTYHELYANENELLTAVTKSRVLGCDSWTHLVMWFDILVFSDFFLSPQKPTLLNS